MALINIVGPSIGDTSELYTVTGITYTSLNREGFGGSFRSQPAAAPQQGIVAAINAASGRPEDGADGEKWATFWIIVSTLPTSNHVLVAHIDGSGLDNGLVLTTGGEFRLGAPGDTDGGTYIGDVVIDQWHRIDLRRAESPGLTRAKLDGGSEVTIAGTTGSLNRLVIGAGQVDTTDIHIADIWFSSSEWAPDNGGVRTAVPTGDSATHTGWTASAGNKWDCLNEIPASGADYISAGTGAGNQTYAATHAARTAFTAAGVKAVKTIARMRESTATTTLGAWGIRSGGADYLATAIDLGGTTELNRERLYENDPATSAAWTNTNFDACEPVVQRSTSDTSNIRCTGLYVVFWASPHVAGAPTDVEWEGTVTSVLTTASAGGPVDVEWEGFTTTPVSTEVWTAGAQTDVEWEGFATAAYQETYLVGVPADVEWEGTTTIPVWLEEAGSPVDVEWEGLSSTFIIHDVTPDEGLRVDFYSAAGVKLDVPPLAQTAILNASYALSLGKLGSFSLTVAAGEGTEVINGRQVWLYYGDEDLVFKGQIDNIETEVTADGRRVKVATGFTPGRLALVKKTTLNRRFDNSSLSTIMTALMSGSTYSSGSLATPSTNLTIPFFGNPLWDALNKIASGFGLLLREDPIGAVVDINSFGDNSGVVFGNISEHSPELAQNTTFAPISTLRVKARTRDVWNKIIPIGQQQSVSSSQQNPWLTLEHSTRTTGGGFPYAIQSATGPDGATYYYISDSTSVTAHGTCEKYLALSFVEPLGVTATDVERAANTLYDLAATALQREKDEQVAYEVEVTNLKHLISGVYTFEPGQKVRLQYDGAYETEDGREAIISVDTDLYIMGYTRTFDEIGANTWEFVVSTIAKEQVTDSKVLTDFVSNVVGQQVTPMPFIMDADGSYWDENGIVLASTDQLTDAILITRTGATSTILLQGQILDSALGGALNNANVKLAARGGSGTNANDGFIFLKGDEDDVDDSYVLLGIDSGSEDVQYTPIMVSRKVLVLGTGDVVPNDSATHGDGQGVIFVCEALTVPSSNPTGGGILYVESGSLKFRTSAGNIRTVAAV